MSKTLEQLKGLQALFEEPQAKPRRAHKKRVARKLSHDHQVENLLREQNMRPAQKAIAASWVPSKRHVAKGSLPDPSKVVVKKYGKVIRISKEG